MKFVCGKCKRLVVPRGNEISCCGITEKLQECIEENERYQYAVKKSRARMNARLFDPVAVHWNEDTEDFDIYEGIPNT